MTFNELVARARMGDAEAARTLVAEYEPQVRRVARARLTSATMRREIDSLDICQSVFAAFFTGLALGQYELASPEQLIKLLAAMARHKAIRRAEREQAAKRDVRRKASHAVDELDIAANASTPSQIVATRELLQQMLGRLTSEEREIVVRRGEGRSWPELAEEFGVPPDALRVRHRRAVSRVRGELGWDDDAAY